MRVLVLVNAEGGTAASEGADQLRERVAQAFARRAIDATIEVVQGADIMSQARAAIERTGDAARYDAIVVGGGDGTISGVAGLLAGTGIPLGVLPLGTLNHFAKDLGIPTGIDDAIGVIAEGNVRPVDVGEANGRVFINNSSLGLYPAMVALRDKQRKELGRAKWLAMGASCLAMLRQFPRRRVMIRVEGRPRHTPCLFVGNNTYATSGIFSLGERKALDRGELCIYVVNHGSRLALLRLALRAALGRIDEERDFERLCMPSIEIAARRPLRVAFDGEIVEMTPPLIYRIRPGALRVFAPRPSEAADTPHSENRD